MNDAGDEFFHDQGSGNIIKVHFKDNNSAANIAKELDDLLCKIPDHHPHPAKTDWAKAEGLNCYGSRGGDKSHGSTDLETPASASCGKMSITDCQKKCDKMEKCDAVTIGSDGSCYRKSDVVPNECDTDAS